MTIKKKNDTRSIQHANNDSVCFRYVCRASYCCCMHACIRRERCTLYDDIRYSSPACGDIIPAVRSCHAPHTAVTRYVVAAYVPAMIRSGEKERDVPGTSIIVPGTQQDSKFKRKKPVKLRLPLACIRYADAVALLYLYKYKCVVKSN